VKETMNNADQTLLKIEFTIAGGKLEVNKEAISDALNETETHVTAIALLTLLDYFVDKETFLKGMKKTAKDIEKTLEKLDQHLAMVENIGKNIH
jgi:predicted DNA-binding protein YlxM (UPF0122 family)